MGWDLLIERETRHDSSGRFCGMDAAITVTKDGERYKVVRQYTRRRKGGEDKEEISVRRHPRRVKASVAEAASRVHEMGAVAVSRARLSGWVPMREVIGAR